MPPEWWIAKHLRTVRWYQYENGKHVAAHQRRQSAESPDGAVHQDGDESTTERIPNHGDH